MIDFRYPLVFVAYIFLMLMVLFRWATRKRRARELERWGDEKVRQRLFARVSANTSVWKRRICWWGLAFLVFAASGPRIGSKLTEVERQGVDVLVALDISTSMKAEDVRPTRLDKAKWEILQLISALRGDRIGLIVFAGTSYLYLPLTLDYDAARLFLEAVDTDLIRVQGTALAEAIEQAISAFPQEDEKHRVLILVTDGDDHEGRVSEMVEQAVQQGIVIHTAGVGTADKVFIPVTDEHGTRDHKRDKRGQKVRTTLNERILRDIAGKSGGIFVRLDNSSAGMPRIMDEINGMEKQTLTTYRYSGYEDRFQFFAAWAFFLLAGEMFVSNRRKARRKWRGRFV